MDWWNGWQFAKNSERRQVVTDYEKAAYEAHIAMLRAHMLTIASGCRIWGGEAERARKMLEEALALPTDDSALQQRLAEEREKCAKLVDTAYRTVCLKEVRECAAAIRSMK